MCYSIHELSQLTPDYILSQSGLYILGEHLLRTMLNGDSYLLGDGQQLLPEESRLPTYPLGDEPSAYFVVLFAERNLPPCQHSDYMLRGVGGCTGTRVRSANAKAPNPAMPVAAGASAADTPNTSSTATTTANILAVVMIIRTQTAAGVSNLPDCCCN